LTGKLSVNYKFMLCKKRRDDRKGSNIDHP
jgi:hypothetical protein